MLMLKLIGLLMLIVTGTYIGFSKSRCLSNRVDFLEEYIGFLSYIETQVRYSSDCIVNILDDYDSKNRLNFIDCCLLKMNNGAVFIKSWNESIDEIPDSVGLKNEDKNLLRSFGNELGKSDIEGQISHCKLYQKLTSQKLEEARMQKQQKYRLYQMLGASLGLCVGLLFI